MTTTSADPLAALARALPGSTLISDDGVLASLASDDAEWAPVGRPVAAVRARSTEEVRHVVRACAELRIPVVPRGAGTGLSGGANAVDGCLVIIPGKTLSSSRRLSVSHSGRWELELATDATLTDSSFLLLLGREDIRQKAERFAASYPDALANRAAFLARVDMRYANGFAVRWVDAADQERYQLAARTALEN